MSMPNSLPLVQSDELRPLLVVPVVPTRDLCLMDALSSRPVPVGVEHARVAERSWKLGD